MPKPRNEGRTFEQAREEAQPQFENVDLSECMTVRDIVQTVLHATTCFQLAALAAFEKRWHGLCSLHTATDCTQTGKEHRCKSTSKGSGYWVVTFTCPACKRTGKFHKNYLGQRKVACDGIQFLKVQNEN